MDKNVTFSKREIQEAHDRIKPFIHNTPILSSQAINRIAGCSLFFKCENFQKIGAFKMRGAANAISQLSNEGKKNGVVAHSSGNHAQAVAKAAQLANITAYLVMPNNAPKVKVEAVKEYGGQITFCEPNLKAREEGVKTIIQNTGAQLIHPFNDKDIILGQASVAKELLAETKQLDAIICPVGGGGLLSGTLLTTKHFAPSVDVYAGEPELAKDAFESVTSGRLIPAKNNYSIADGLLTSLGELNFQIIASGVKEILLVDEKEILKAMRLIWERMKIVVEPSCAVPLAAILRNPSLFKNKKVGVILTGGNVDLDVFFESYFNR